jgi:hypothetical protein
LEQLANRLKTEQQSLKALQQCIVQVTRDAGALFHALLEPPAYPIGDLADPQIIQRQHQQ